MNNFIHNNQDCFFFLKIQFFFLKKWFFNILSKKSGSAFRSKIRYFLSDFQTPWKTIKSYNFGSEWRFDLSILEILPFDVLEENVMFDGLFASMRSYASQSLRYTFLHKLQRNKNTKWTSEHDFAFHDLVTPLRTETASLDNQTG